jgi:hypothetical protein
LDEVKRNGDRVVQDLGQSAREVVHAHLDLAVTGPEARLRLVAGGVARPHAHERRGASTPMP